MWHVKLKERTSRSFFWYVNIQIKYEVKILIFKINKDKISLQISLDIFIKKIFKAKIKSIWSHVVLPRLSFNCLSLARISSYLCIKSLFVSQWSHQQSINISQLCLRISSLAVHRQQRSQRTKVEHRPWNDASFSFYKTQTILGHCFGKKGEGRFFQEPRSCVYAVPVTEDAHTQRDRYCQVYTLHNARVITVHYHTTIDTCSLVIAALYL